MRSMRRAAFAPLLLFLASCWMPPFDPAISISERTARKMERVAGIGPVEFGDQRSDKSYFVPSYEERPADGYWVGVEGDDRLAIRYVGLSAGRYALGPEYSSQPNYWRGLNAVQAMSEISAGVLSSGMKAAHVWGGSVVGTASSEALLGIGLNTDFSFLASPSAATSGFSYEMRPIGGSARNDSTPALVRHLLMSGYDAGTYVLSVSDPMQQLHSAAYSGPTITNNGLSYPGPELRPGAFFLEYTDAYSITHDLVVGRPKEGDAIVGFRWSAVPAGRASAPAYVDFDAQVTDVLHDDTLVARGEVETRFYDVGGAALYSIPTGALRYVHEYYDGAAWYCYFTRVAVRKDPRDDDKGTAYFEVFRFPSADLAELGG